VSRTLHPTAALPEALAAIYAAQEARRLAALPDTVTVRVEARGTSRRMAYAARVFARLAEEHPGWITATTLLRGYRSTRERDRMHDALQALVRQGLVARLPAEHPGFSERYEYRLSHDGARIAQRVRSLMEGRQAA
jgi:hypothetical protein